MAMISGPFTDAVVEMLRRSDRPGGMTGLWKNGAGVYGLSDGALFWHGGGIVSAADPASFAPRQRILFPERAGDGFRLVTADSLWVLPLTEAERAVFSRWYAPVGDGEALARIAAARGEARDAAFALRCKLGFPDEGREEALAVIEKVLLKL